MSQTVNEPKVPLLDLKAQYDTLRDEIEPVIREVVESQYFVMGPQVTALERDIAEYCGTKHAIGCANGSDAILLALMAIGAEPGDEVICPSYTFFATGGSTARLGVKPVWADIDPATYNMDPAHVRELAAKCTRLKAIMPVHLFGQAADMDELLAIGAEFGVPVIEDAAQAIGTEDARGIRVGSRGLIGCFSFFPSKNLGCFGDGGIVTTNDDKLAELLSILRLHGGKPKYYHRIVGMNSRLDALQAAVLQVKLRHLEAWHAGRQANAAFYDRAFAALGAATSETPLAEGGFPVRTPYRLPAPNRHIYNQYCIRVPAEVRDQVRDDLAKRGVGTEIYYPVPLHMQECFAYLGGKEGDLPHSEAAARETIALPIYAELDDAQKRHVVRCVAESIAARVPVNA